MLVSVDAEKGTVTVYGESVITVPISQIHKLKSMLWGKTVRYVSEVLEVNGADVLAMVEDMSASGELVSASGEENSDGRLWLRATGSGQLFVQLDAKRSLKFEHRGDFVSLDKYGYDISERYPVVRNLLKRKLLELCSTVRMNKIKKIEAARQTEREEQQLGSLIVDTSVKGKDPKILAATLAAKRRGLGPDDTIDMDDYRAPPSKTEGLTDDQQRVLQEGWGKEEVAEEDEGKGEEETEARDFWDVTNEPQ